MKLGFADDIEIKGFAEVLLKRMFQERRGTYDISPYNVSVVVFWFFVVTRFLEEHGFKSVDFRPQGL